MLILRPSTSFLLFSVSLPAPALAQSALDRIAPAASLPAEAPEAPVPTAVRPSIEIEGPAKKAKPPVSVFAGAVTIVGMKALIPADFADILGRYVGRLLPGDQLAELAGSIADRARSRGYALATAWIEPQRVSSGVLVVRLDEGRIDELRFEGPEQAAVRRALSPLADGNPVRIEELERRVLIAGDIDGVRVRRTRFVREGERGILIVQVAEERTATRLVFANDGTRPVGPEQLRFDLDVNGVLAADDALSVTYSTTPFQPEELWFGRVRYGKRVSANGTELAFVTSGSIAHPGAYLKPFDLESRSWFVGAELLRPMLRRRDESLWFQAELGVRSLRQSRRDVLIRDDRLTVARATLHGYSQLAGGRIRISSTLSQGLNLFGATGPRDPMSSRFDADATFTSLSIWSDWTRTLGGPFSFRAAAQSQFASQPLLISEETGLGGTGFLRGYDWSERSGDEGVMALAELRYLWKQPFKAIRRAQLYAFIDGGEVDNLRSGFGSGSLASTGGGIRADVTARFGANFEVAVPLSGARYDTNDRTPKLNFRLVRSF